MKLRIALLGTVAFVQHVTATVAAHPSLTEKRLVDLECQPSWENYTAEIEYEGCFLDTEGARALPGYSTSMSSNTPESCAFICGRSGFIYSGVEFGR